jgi:hypothetical protein
MDKTVIAEAFQSLMDRSYVRFDETATPGYMNLDYWNDYQDFFYNNKLLSQKVVVEDIVTDDYLE